MLAGYFFFRRPAKLTETDTIVLADFANSTGDPVFDDTLKTALTIALRQSPFLAHACGSLNQWCHLWNGIVTVTINRLNDVVTVRDRNTGKVCSERSSAIHRSESR